MNRWRFWVSIAAAAAFGFLLSQDALARLAWHQFGRPDIAISLIRRDADLAMLLGNYYFGATHGKSEYDLEKAKRAFEKALRAKPGALWGHYQLARIYFLEGGFERALEEINRELEANPENLRALYVRGLIYGYRNTQGDLERAEQDFGRFTNWAPKEWGGYNDHSWILSRLGRHGEALEVIRSAFQNVPQAETNPWLWNSRGLAELNLGEYVSAETSFEKAVEFNQKLTVSDWMRAYPGNDPAGAESGLSSFRQAVEENLRRGVRGDKQP